MNCEKQRAESFGRWPHTEHGFAATPFKLAKSGFFHEPTPAYPDRVVCFCCGVALVHWNRVHDPWTEHCKRAPNCGFVTGAHGMFSREDARFASFTTWPHPPSFAATPAKLAKAGFFHHPSAQFLDRSVCFCCGVALVRWEAADDPWTEHLKHCKTCPFVRAKSVGNVPVRERFVEEEIESVVGALVDKLEASGVDPVALAPSYALCPITQDLMRDPVVAEDGHSYEREAIKRWFLSHNTSPLTNKALYSKRVVANHNLRAHVIHFCELLASERAAQTAPDGAPSASPSADQVPRSAGGVACRRADAAPADAEHVASSAPPPVVLSVPPSSPARTAAGGADAAAAEQRGLDGAPHAR